MLVAALVLGAAEVPRRQVAALEVRPRRAVEDAVSGLYERGKDELRGIGVALMNAAELTASLLSSPAHAS